MKPFSFLILTLALISIAAVVVPALPKDSATKTVWVDAAKKSYARNAELEAELASLQIRYAALQTVQQTPVDLSRVENSLRWIETRLQSLPSSPPRMATAAVVKADTIQKVIALFDGDTSTVARVEFSVDDTPLKSASEAPWTTLWKPTPGVYGIVVKAMLDDGSILSSPPTVVEVVP